MARDGWRVVLAASAAVALAAVCTFGGHVQAKGAKGQDPAAAQRAVAAAAKLLDAGKVDRAVRSLTATLSGGNLPPPVLAKALYVRGLAYRRQSKPAHAISDLSAALWLKGGLGGEERANALKERSAAYADAGLTGRGEARASRTAERAPAQKAGGDWLSSLFSATPSAPPPRRPPPRVTGTAEKSERLVAAKAPRAIGGWGSGTEVREADRAERVARRAPAAPEAEARPAGGGRYQVQLPPVRTKAQALALAAKAKREHAVVLAASRPVIDRAVLGNMGSFYRVRFGPFASAQQTQAVCAKLKGSGLDCMTVTQ